MTTKFHPLTDDALDGLRGDALNSREALLVGHYRDLRERYVAETEALTKRDRSAILRMAGNIAGGFCADPEFEAETWEDIAVKAVAVARAIVVEVDR